MTELTANKQTINQFLSGIDSRNFIIPEYQRPYSWDVEKCETLWLDIQAHYEDNKNAREKDAYFLGTIVSYKDEVGNLQIIDGQQRITSLLLLLRSFYTKLEAMNDSDKDIKGLKRQIEPCIWKINKMNLEVEDREAIHLKSLVITDQEKGILHKLIAEGEATDTKNNSNYYKNYNFFLDKCDKFAADFPMDWKEFCLSIMSKCIILPIECNQEETAHTIFSTLNDRGMPLADADIFKAQIYKSKEKEKREEFIEEWKNLTDICDQAKISLDDVFRYYSHILRAKAKITHKEVALRKFYSDGKYKKLQDPCLMDDLVELAKFWLAINSDGDEKIYESPYNLSKTARKYLQCLKKYPNEYWKYIVSVYFYVNKDKKDFEKSLVVCLEESVRFLFAKFIDKPTVNAIKDDVFQGCKEIWMGKSRFFKRYTPLDIDQKIQTPPPRIVRALLWLHAYLNKGQGEKITGIVHIEHILPKKWQEAYYRDWNREDAADYLEKIGNKVLLEEKTNIQAGNGYFGEKKTKYYSKSKIADVHDICQKYTTPNWHKKDIENREEEVVKRLSDFFDNQIKISDESNPAD